MTFTPSLTRHFPHHHYCDTVCGMLFGVLAFLLYYVLLLVTHHYNFVMQKGECGVLQVQVQVQVHVQVQSTAMLRN